MILPASSFFCDGLFMILLACSLLYGSFSMMLAAFISFVKVFLMILLASSFFYAGCLWFCLLLVSSSRCFIFSLIWSSFKHVVLSETYLEPTEIVSLLLKIIFKSNLQVLPPYSYHRSQRQRGCISKPPPPSGNKSDCADKWKQIWTFRKTPA